jgi:3-deoxy-7-phosphoheptulonate synthase
MAALQPLTQTPTMPPTSDIRIRSVRPLISPAILEDELPLGHRQVPRPSLPRRGPSGGGPCRAGPGRPLAGRRGPLLRARSAVSALGLRAHAGTGCWPNACPTDLLVVMRVYFEKPRTVVGWKGLINDPGLDGSFQINRGLRLARQLLLDVTARRPAHCHRVSGHHAGPVLRRPHFLGRHRRPHHREPESTANWPRGLSMPVGFKNRTDGDLQVAVDAILSARHPHSFPVAHPRGRPCRADHLLAIRTATWCCGAAAAAAPTFRPTHIAQAVRPLLQKAAVPRARSWWTAATPTAANAMTSQPAVAHDVAAQIAAGQRAIIGVMLESHLVAGCPIGGQAGPAADLRPEHHRRLPGVRRRGAGAGTRWPRPCAPGDTQTLSKT